MVCTRSHSLLYIYTAVMSGWLSSVGTGSWLSMCQSVPSCISLQDRGVFAKQVFLIKLNSGALPRKAHPTRPFKSICRFVSFYHSSPTQGPSFVRLHLKASISSSLNLGHLNLLFTSEKSLKQALVAISQQSHW